MIRSNIILMGAAAAIFGGTASLAQSFDFKILDGKWLVINVEGKGLAQPIQFQPAPFGYDAVMPFFEGFSAVTASDGHNASHIKVESRKGEKCYYYVGFTSNDKMTWALTDGDAPCVKSAVYERDRSFDSASDQLIRECDRLAADPFDPKKPLGVVGIEFADIEPANAILACQKAFSSRADEPRIAFEYGRALQRTNNFRSKVEAVELYRTAADNGYAAAKQSLGVMYRDGLGVVRDDKKALELFRAAADAGVAPAMSELGKRLRDGSGLQNNDEEAMQWFRKAANAGDPAAMASLGVMLSQGRGARKDDQEATQWFQLAAEAGDVSAMTALAERLSSGNGVTRNEIEAVRLYLKASQSGYSISASGMYYVASAYAKGIYGLSQDDQKAAQWFKKAADAGNSAAMRETAERYEKGKSYPQNVPEAARWYNKAAEAGDPKSMFVVGMYYENGYGGLNKDYKSALSWYNKSNEASPSAEAASAITRVKTELSTATFQCNAIFPDECYFMIYEYEGFELLGSWEDGERKTILHLRGNGETRTIKGVEVDRNVYCVCINKGDPINYYRFCERWGCRKQGKVRPGTNQ